MRDGSVTKQKLPPGTLGRIMRFASPYRKILGVFLGVIVVDALIGVWNPLIYRQIIDGGIQSTTRASSCSSACSSAAWRSRTPSCPSCSATSPRGSARG